jgi:hypothetical protein
METRRLYVCRTPVASNVWVNDARRRSDIAAGRMFGRSRIGFAAAVTTREQGARGRLCGSGRTARGLPDSVRHPGRKRTGPPCRRRFARPSSTGTRCGWEWAGAEGLVSLRPCGSIAPRTRHCPAKNPAIALLEQLSAWPHARPQTSHRYLKNGSEQRANDVCRNHLIQVCAKEHFVHLFRRNEA